MTLSKYQIYKGSGVEWIGDIPETWGLKRVSWLFQLVGSGTTPPSDVGRFYGDGTPWVTTGELREGVIDMTAKSVTPLALSTFPALRVYDPGTILIAMYGATIGRLSLLGIPACTNQACCAMSKPRNVIPKFAFFALLGARTHIVELAVGGGQPNINQETIRSLRLPTPPENEQRMIASYLDAQTAKIDTLIGKQEQLIETLTERRQAVISHAVTKGLDPNVPMKDSRVDRVGDVPGHWEVGNIRRFASMRTGHTPSRSNPEYWIDCDIPWFTLADVWQLRKGQRYLGETNGTISELGLANSAADLLPAGTVVLSRTASVGFTGIMPVAMATSQDYWNWVCRPELDPTYLWFQFHAMRPHFASLVQGSTHKTIYQTDAAALKITAPPINEQREIVDYLDQETAKIDALSAKAREMIEIFKERRQALISAAVTGKIDVRGLS